MHCVRRDRWNDEQRKIRGCSRIDLPLVPWHVDARALRREGWMGRAPLPPSHRTQGGIEVAPKHPWEDPADGCPGGWYRSRFVHSLLPFLRRRVDGHRVQNHLLDRCDDDLVILLVHELEAEQERWENWREEQQA